MKILFAAASVRLRQRHGRYRRFVRLICYRLVCCSKCSSQTEARMGVARKVTVRLLSHMQTRDEHK